MMYGRAVSFVYRLLYVLSVAVGTNLYDLKKLVIIFYRLFNFRLLTLIRFITKNLTSSFLFFFHSEKKSFIKMSIKFHLLIRWMYMYSHMYSRLIKMTFFYVKC